MERGSMYSLISKLDVLILPVCKINQLLMEAQFLATQKNKKGKGAPTIAVQRPTTPKTTISQLNESLKVLSDVESVAKARCSNSNV